MASNENYIADLHMQIGNSTICPVTIFRSTSGEIKTSDGDIWKISEHAQGRCLAKSTTKFAEVCLFYCYNCPNKDNCKLN